MSAIGLERATRSRTIEEAHRIPQWERLIVTIHKAQEAAGFDGRHFGADEMRFFGETLIGLPWEERYATRVYWTTRQTLTHSDGTGSIAYTVKVWDKSTPATVDTIARSDAAPLTPEEDAALCLEYVRRATFQVGGTL